MSDYAERIALVERHKNTLEGLVAPQLVQALNHVADVGVGVVGQMGPDSTATEEVTQLIELLTRIGRGEAAVRYYSDWVKVSLRYLLVVFMVIMTLASFVLLDEAKGAGDYNPAERFRLVPERREIRCS